MTQNLMQATSLLPKVLSSQQLPDTNQHPVYTCPANTAAILKHGTLCNVSGGSVTVTVAIVPNGGTYDGTHRILSALPLAAGDTFSLRDYVAGACLGPGDAVYVQAGTANAIDVTLTGTEAS